MLEKRTAGVYLPAEANSLRCAVHKINDGDGGGEWGDNYFHVFSGFGETK